MITEISLDSLNELFPSYHFTKLMPTLFGTIDTTYIAHTKEAEYILKKYERHIPTKIEQDSKFLQKLNAIGLNVSLCLDANSPWYLYKKLKGTHPTDVKSYHIQALGRFMAHMHQASRNIKYNANTHEMMQVEQELSYAKGHFFSYYKQFEFLRNFTQKSDALIHGDIFKDNTLFDEKKIGVIDFIDSFNGSFAFDAGVALIGFDVREKNRYLINTFLIAYNQHAPQKLTYENLQKKMKAASHFYALKRVHKYKNTQKARELLR